MVDMKPTPLLAMKAFHYLFITVDALLLACYISLILLCALEETKFVLELFKVNLPVLLNRAIIFLFS